MQSNPFIWVRLENPASWIKSFTIFFEQDISEISQ